MWTYMPYGPFSSYTEFETWAKTIEGQLDPMFYAILVPDASTNNGWTPLGLCAYLRINPDMASIEVGWLTYSSQLRGTTASTEAMILMMRYGFSLGYRRYEWKCNRLNGPSRQAARRLGMGFEGLFKAHFIVKGLNRDTTWYAVTEHQWPELNEIFTKWLDPQNFDASGRNKLRLSEMTRHIYDAGCTVKELQPWA